MASSGLPVADFDGPTTQLLLPPARVATSSHASPGSEGGASRQPGVRWKCPECRRQFGRRNQSHECTPSGTVAEFFAGRPPVQRKIYDAIVKHLKTLGPLLIDPVKVCIMFKRTRSFAEVRSKKNSLVLAMLLSRHATHPKLSKTLKLSANRVAHFIELARVEDFDAAARELLTESFLDSLP